MENIEIITVNGEQYVYAAPLYNYINKEELDKLKEEEDDEELQYQSYYYKDFKSKLRYYGFRKHRDIFSGRELDVVEEKENGYLITLYSAMMYCMLCNNTYSMELAKYFLYKIKTKDTPKMVYEDFKELESTKPELKLVTKVHKYETEEDTNTFDSYKERMLNDNYILTNFTIYKSEEDDLYKAISVFRKNAPAEENKLEKALDELKKLSKEEIEEQFEKSFKKFEKIKYKKIGE